MRKPHSDRHRWQRLWRRFSTLLRILQESILFPKIIFVQNMQMVDEHRLDCSFCFCAHMVTGLRWDKSMILMKSHQHIALLSIFELNMFFLHCTYMVYGYTLGKVFDLNKGLSHLLWVLDSDKYTLRQVCIIKRESLRFCFASLNYRIAIFYSIKSYY